MTDDTQLLISFVKTKINTEGKITDVETQTKIMNLLLALKRIVVSSK